MKKLNVGDRVKMVRPSCYSFDKVGNTGTVVELDKGYVTVSVDGQGKPTIGDGWHYLESAESWELLKDESKMTKFKVGDKVVIKDNFHGHGFKMGDVVVISKLRFEGYEGHKVGDNSKECWAFDDSEIEEYKEEVKVQKFKVGDKVRMVKLRSDGLSYSFDKIGNEGVVIGIGSKFIQVEVHGKDNPWEGEGWTYPLENKCWELVEVESNLRVTSIVEPMCIYSFDSVEDMEVFLKIADQDGFDVDSCEYGIQEHGSETRFRVNNYKSISYGTYAYDTLRFPEYERVQFKVEEEKEMLKCKFKVGDLVKGNDPGRYFYTNDKMTKGVVLEVHNHDDIKVKLLEHTVSVVVGDAHNVDPQYFDFYEEPKLVQNEKPKTTVLKLGEYKIVFNGDTTVVTDGVGKGVAKRHPDDEYDAVVGLQVAIERFNGGTRKPKIGDKVRVLKVDGNSRYGGHCYDIGDIVTVTGFAHYYANTDICCKDRYGFKQTLTASEYEVLG